MDSPRSKCIPNMKNLSVGIILHTLYTKQFAHVFCHTDEQLVHTHTQTCACVSAWEHPFICLFVFWAFILSFSYFEIVFTNFYIKNKHLFCSLLLVIFKHSESNTHRKDYGKIWHWKRKKCFKDTDIDHMML